VLEEAFHEAQAQTAARHLMVHRLAAAIERLEELRRVRRVDAVPAVLDSEAELRPRRAVHGGRDADPAAPTRVFQRVAHEVFDRLAERPGVTRHEGKRGVDLLLDRHARFADERIERREGAIDFENGECGMGNAEWGMRNGMRNEE